MKKLVKHPRSQPSSWILGGLTASLLGGVGNLSTLQGIDISDLGNKEHHLQTYLGWGYVCSQEGTSPGAGQAPKENCNMQHSLLMQRSSESIGMENVTLFQLSGGCIDKYLLGFPPQNLSQKRIGFGFLLTHHKHQVDYLHFRPLILMLKAHIANHAEACYFSVGLRHDPPPPSILWTRALYQLLLCKFGCWQPCSGSYAFWLILPCNHELVWMGWIFDRCFSLPLPKCEIFRCTIRGHEISPIQTLLLPDFLMSKSLNITTHFQKCSTTFYPMTPWCAQKHLPS